MDEIEVGKYVLETLTRSMYTDSRSIFREYIQNSADQIDELREAGREDYYGIYIDIDDVERRIIIEDNATGVKSTDIDNLRHIAKSKKVRGKKKGFRGIGRLGGLGYCDTLVFETSFEGENIKTIMTYDAKTMMEMVDDYNDESKVGEVVTKCLTITKEPEDCSKHYFRVIMNNVSEDNLLDRDDIVKYLTMVAPLDYPTSFGIFSSKIKAFAKENGYKLDTYNVFIKEENGGYTQLYKGYSTKIYEKTGKDLNDKRSYDVQDVKFFNKCFEDGSPMYWGWYSISELPGVISSINVAYGMRLRCENIQVGDEKTCRVFFKEDGDKRFSQYFFGELFVVSDKLFPDSRREYIRADNKGYRTKFENEVRADFLKLKNLCQEASDIRSAAKKYNNAVEGQNKIEDKKEKGFLNEVERAKSEQDFAKYQKDKEKYRKQFAQMKQKSEEAQSPLNFMIQNLENASPSLTSSPSNSDKQKQNTSCPENTDTVTSVHEDEPKTKLRTDNPIYKKFGVKEKRVINSVYSAIYTAIADDQLREILINKIEQEITK